MFRNIFIIGLGLMGGSLALAIKKNNLAEKITGCARENETAAKAKSLGIIDEIATNISEASQSSDLIIIASPLSTYKNIAAQISAKTNALIIDLGSLKAAVIPEIINNIAENLQGNFIPCHPIAGSEKSGINAADANLYSGKKIIITPLEKNTSENIKKISDFWQALGCEVKKLSPEKHDEIYAEVSHLPQLLSYAIISCYRENLWLPESPGHEFKTFLRLSGSNPSIWKEIFQLNQKNIDNKLGNYLQELYGKVIDLNNKKSAAKPDDKVNSLYIPAILGQVLFEEVVDAEILEFSGSGFRDFTSLKKYCGEIPASSYGEISAKLTKISVSIDKFRRFIEDDLIEYFEKQIVRGV